MRPLKVFPTRTGVQGFLDECARANARSVLLKVPNRPMMRADGAWTPLRFDPLTPSDTHGLLGTLLELAGMGPLAPTRRRARFGVAADGQGRFSVTAVRQRGSWVIALRRVQSDAPTLVGAGLDGRALRLLDGAPGLILVGGPRRPEMLGALARHVAAATAEHLVVVEDPLLWLHRDGRGMVSQLEVGVDVPGVYAGMVTARRLEAGTWVVPDLAGTREAEAAVRAAEDGVRVIAGVRGPHAEDLVGALAGRWPTWRRAELGARLRAVRRGTLGGPDAEAGAEDEASIASG